MITTDTKPITLIEIDGKVYAGLFINTETGVTDPCWLCGYQHAHGIGSVGHRMAHCVGVHAFDTHLGTVSSRDGYYLIAKTP